MASPRKVVEPPFYDPPIADFPSGQQHSHAWTQYHQSVADALANVHAGISDGSDAAPGQIGEYMTSTSTAVGVGDGAVTNLAAVNLTPGDWDVSGYVAFNAGAGTHSFFACGIISVDTFLVATFPTGALSQLLPTTTHRVNITVPTTVWVVGQTSFTGSMTAQGSIRARRMR
jgi:hypothetical protein